MEIPYSELELRIALMGLPEEKFTEEKLKELDAEFAVLIPVDKKDFNEKVAEYQGISVEQLINSKNYKILREEYRKKIIKEVARKFKEKFDITEKQKWALLAFGEGLLNTLDT